MLATSILLYSVCVFAAGMISSAVPISMWRPTVRFRMNVHFSLLNLRVILVCRATVGEVYDFISSK